MVSHVVANLLTTIQAVVSVCVLLGVGFVLVRKKILDQHGITALSKLVNGLFLPLALFLRLGSTLSWEVLQKTWQLPIVFILPVMMSFFIGGVVVNHAGVDRRLKAWLVVGLAFPNNLAIPLTFLYSICLHAQFDVQDGITKPGDPPLTGPYLTREQCYASGELFLFMGNLFSTFVFWLVAYDIAAALTGGGVPMSDDSDETLLENSQTSTSASPAQTAPPRPPSVTASQSDMLEIGDRVVDAVVDAPQFRSVEDSAWSEVRSAALSQHEQVRKWTQLNRLPKFLTKLKGIGPLFLRPPIFAQIIAIIIAMIPPAQWLLFAPGSPVSSTVNALGVFSQANVPALNLVLCGSLGLKLCSMPSLRQPNFESVGLTAQSMAYVVVARMLLLPALSFAMLYGIQKSGLIPENNLLYLVTYLPVLTPTGNGPVVLAQMSGAKRAGQALALMILFQYLAGIIFMSGFVFLAFTLAYH